MAKKTYFLSDLHLGAPYFEDSKEAEKRVVKFLDFIKDEAEAIYLVGDVLDYWFEYRYVVPRGYVRFFGKLAELADKGIKITWLIGNHDIWLFDYLQNELGIEVADGYIIRNIHGKKIFISHGDGLGKLPFSFNLIRTVFRNRVCQKLYSGLHPRWTVPFAYNWSRSSRAKGERNLDKQKGAFQNLKKFAISYHSIHPDVNYFIFGHIHMLTSEIIAPGCEVIVLGEWIRTFSYAVADDTGIYLRKWS